MALSIREGDTSSLTLGFSLKQCYSATCVQSAFTSSWTPVNLRPLLLLAVLLPALAAISLALVRFFPTLPSQGLNVLGVAIAGLDFRIFGVSLPVPPLIPRGDFRIACSSFIFSRQRR